MAGVTHCPLHHAKFHDNLLNVSTPHCEKFNIFQHFGGFSIYKYKLPKYVPSNVKSAELRKTMHLSRFNCNLSNILYISSLSVFVTSRLVPVDDALHLRQCISFLEILG